METQNTETAGYNEQMIYKALEKTRQRLGLVPSELENVHRRMQEELKDEKTDRKAVESWLDWFERQADFEPLNGATLTEAREFLELDREQMAHVCGYEKTKSRSHIYYRLEKGQRLIIPSISRLVRSFLSGYRPPDWPDRP